MKTESRHTAFTSGAFRQLAIAACLLLLAITPGVARAADVDSIPAEELLGRLLLLAYPGTEPPLGRLEEFQPAGFLFYPGNIPSTETVRTAVRALQEQTDWPLLYGIDQEGGPFTTYRVDDATIFPGNMALGAAGRPDLAEAAARASGEELARAGLNLSFSPAVDVNSNPDNPIIGVRSFGSDPAAVSTLGLAYAAGLGEAGVAAVAKHFPGHGDTGTDSHLALPVATGDLERLDRVELPPFQALIDGGIPVVMTAHVAFPVLGSELPATLSEAALTGLLRGQLGFQGLIVTDYMDMDAIVAHYGAGEAAVLSVRAGADLLLLGPDLETQREVASALRAALHSGELPAQRVRDAVARSRALALEHPPRLDGPLPDYTAHAELAEEIGISAATLLWNEDVLPLAQGADTLVVAVQPTGYGAAPHLGDILSRSLDGVRSIAVPADPDSGDIETVLSAAEGADVLVLGVYHWLGAFPAGMAQLEAALVETGVPVVVVALGNPDSNRFLPGTPAAYLAVYGYREANLEGAAAVLSGRSEPRGRLPVPAGEWPVGSGLSGFQD